ncbi:MAG: 3-carboxy-cis,cis-muconate cycloisomerase [Methylibium sp.]|nr:3-carboxy-cis,cis-muconate cycloisomerase [Methylibium sp.]
MAQPVFEGFLSTPEMAALLDERGMVQAMMDFEAALARAQARAGVIPTAAAQAISSLCRAELYDVTALVGASARAGSLALPVIDKLTETVALFDPVAAGFVHWGSTGQDVLDSALALQTQRALRLIDADLLRLCEGLLDLVEASPAMPMLARTLMQPAQVTSLRFKAMGWLAPLLRCVGSLREQAAEAVLLQFGGLVGTQAALGEQADAVAAELARELGLRLPDAPWQVQRDRWVRLGAEIGILCGVLGKYAGDLALLSQAEVGEIREPLAPGRSGPCGYASKDNPVACLLALAAAKRAPQRVAGLLACMNQEHERGLGGWQAEQAEFAGLLQCCHSGLQALALALPLRVNPARMLQNIDRQLDLVCAEALVLLLAASMGRGPAQTCVEQMCQQVRTQGRPLRQLARELLQGDAVLAAAISPASLEAVFDPHAAAQRADGRVAQALSRAGAELQALRAAVPDAS